MVKVYTRYMANRVQKGTWAFVTPEKTQCVVFWGFVLFCLFVFITRESSQGLDPHVFGGDTLWMCLSPCLSTVVLNNRLWFKVTAHGKWPVRKKQSLQWTTRTNLSRNRWTSVVVVNFKYWNLTEVCSSCDVSHIWPASSCFSGPSRFIWISFFRGKY